MNIEEIVRRSGEILDYAVEMRRHFHRHPEPTSREFETIRFLCGQLDRMGISYVNIPDGGILAEISGKSPENGETSPHVLLRADCDALTMEESPENGRGPRCCLSANSGVAHMCGHDGHMAMLLGAAKLLSESRDFNGTAQFLFQPAEEPGKGAHAMIDDGLFERFPMDEIYGQHNNPAYPAGTVNICKGGFASCEDNFKIEIHGRGGHASAPEKTVDPMVIAAQIILALQTIPSRNAGAFQPVVVSCTELFTDGAHNAIPSNVTILGDCRSYSKEMQALIETRMRDLVEHICQAYGATWDFLYTHEFAPTVNWDEQVDAVIQAASHVLGEEKVNGNCSPFMASEDFGAFLEKVPGAFFFMGGAVGDESRDMPLHNSCFDYNDDTLETGAQVFAQLVRERLAR